MLVTVLDKDGNKRQKETKSITGAKKFVSAQWWELQMQEPSKIYALIQYEDGEETFSIRVGKATVRYWDSRRIKENPEIYNLFK